MQGGVTQHKSLPLGGKVARPARRMRGIYPGVAPSSVTCGDSFPRRGKPFGRFTRKFSVAVMSRAGHAPPLRGGKFFGGAVRRERVGGASKNVS